MPNHDRTDRPQIFPAPRLPRDLPPFWELEQLLREGFDHDSALAELARRRESRSNGCRLPPVVLETRPHEPEIGIFTIVS
jgi:hypothetical protein